MNRALISCQSLLAGTAAVRMLLWDMGIRTRRAEETVYILVADGAARDCRLVIRRSSDVVVQRMLVVAVVEENMVVVVVEENMVEEEED
jgi:hypothetical protein